MNVFISYANNKYKIQQDILYKSALIENFDKIISYNREDLIKEQFYEENKKILNESRGNGFWLWKPYYLLKTLKELENEDVVVYTDCSDKILPGFKNFIIKKVFENNGFFLVENVYFNFQFVKRDCFVFMDCDNDNYYKSFHLEAGCCAFIKNKNTLDFLNEWLFFCKNYNIISDEKNICGKENLNGFIDHRHDQSVLSLLSKKYGIKTVSMYNEFGFYINYDINHVR